MRGAAWVEKTSGKSGKRRKSDETKRKRKIR
jgi:hypothetical protein